MNLMSLISIVINTSKDMLFTKQQQKSVKENSTAALVTCKNKLFSLVNASYLLTWVVSRDKILHFLKVKQHIKSSACSVTVFIHIQHLAQMFFKQTISGNIEIQLPESSSRAKLT